MAPSRLTISDAYTTRIKLGYVLRWGVGLTRIAGVWASIRMVRRMRDEDREAVGLFRRQVPDLASLGDLVRARDGSPDPSSALAADDLFWPHHPTSQVTWMAMVGNASAARRGPVRGARDCTATQRPGRCGRV